MSSYPDEEDLSRTKSQESFFTFADITSNNKKKSKVQVNFLNRIEIIQIQSFKNSNRQPSHTKLDSILDEDRICVIFYLKMTH